jgi:hypothetical protein
LPVHQLSSSSVLHRYVTTTSTNIPAVTSPQTPEAASISTLNAVTRIAGGARVRKTVLATYRPWECGTESSRSISEQTHTTTRICPSVIRIEPGREAANCTAEASPELTAYSRTLHFPGPPTFPRA